MAALVLAVEEEAGIVVDVVVVVVGVVDCVCLLLFPIYILL